MLFCKGFLYKYIDHDALKHKGGREKKARVAGCCQRSAP